MTSPSIINDMTSESVSDSMSALSLHSGPVQNIIDGHRPDIGTAGKSITITTNHIRITAAPKMFFEYELDFADIPPKKRADGFSPARKIKTKPERMRVIQGLQTAPALLPFDGCWAPSPDFKLIWSTKELPMRKVDNIKHAGRHGGVDVLDYVTFRHNNTYPFGNTTEEIVGTDSSSDTQPILLRIMLSFLSRAAVLGGTLIQVGSNRFFSRTHCIPLGRERLLELRLGYSIDVHAKQDGNLVNVNTTATCFYSPVKLSQLLSYLQLRLHWSPKRLNATLKNLKVKINYARGVVDQGTGFQRDLDTDEARGKVITCFGRPVVEQRFFSGIKDTDGTLVTAYYQARSLPILDGSLFCVNVGANDAINPSQAIWIPAEYLVVQPYQPAHKDLSELVVADMIEHTARRADENKAMVAGEGLRSLGLNDAASLAKADFRVTGQLMDIGARMLLAPKISYNTTTVPKVSDGAWNLLGIKFAKIGALPVVENDARLAMVGITDGFTKEQAVSFYQLMVEQLNSHGFRINPKLTPLLMMCERGRIDHELPGIMARAASRKINMIMVLLPKDDSHHTIYKKVKVMSEQQHGIATVCCVAEKALKKDRQEKLNKQYCSNNALKVNIKTGGTNQAMALVEWPKSGFPSRHEVIIMGADVVHYGGKGVFKGCPSIASVVGTVDSGFGNYFLSARLQRSLQEEIHDMEDMVEERLKAWVANNPGRILKAIYFFRDGVGDSYFERILTTEVPAIYRAWDRIQQFAGNKVELTFITVNKRHQQRVYPATTTPKQFVSEKFGNNIKPGVVVETSICHPWMFDFYLGPHMAIKGTMRPSHYYVLKNDSKLGADAVQKLTHGLSYLHSICTRAVSYAAPAFAADQACDHLMKSGFLEYAFDPENQGHIQRRDEPIKQYYDRCLQRAITENPAWNRAGRPGPWHQGLDDKPFYM